MVYLALGVLAITFSLTVYRIRSLTWTDFPLWTRKGTSRNPANGSTSRGKEDKGSKGQDVIPSFTLQDGEPESSQATSPALQQIGSTHPNESVKPIALAQGKGAMDQDKMPPPSRKHPEPEKKVKQSASNAFRSPPRSNQTAPTLKVPPRPSTTLRPPPSAASTFRAPLVSSPSPSSSSLAPSTSTLAPSSRPSRKVILEPGYSPLDWANLTRNPPTPKYLRGDDVPPNLIRVPPSAVRYHNGRKGRNAWAVYQGKVYNLTPYMKFHPGGVDQLMRGAGKEKEAEKLFNEIHSWINWEHMLGECMIGILVSENEVLKNKVKQDNEMEEMD
ncbi:hypothetical protein ACLMJK_006230 [Lecanora helva]